MGKGPGTKKCMVGPGNCSSVWQELTVYKVTDKRQDCGVI